MPHIAARVGFALASALLSSTALALPFRTYLASYGSDTNPCTVSAPCRLLPAAIAAVQDGGDVWILDSANFNGGTVDIHKSVSILAVPGQIASIVAVAGGPAITVSTAGVSVALRNVVIANNAANPGTFGIVITNGTRVSVEGSLISNFTNNGIYIHDTTTSLHVADTTVRKIADFAIRAENGPDVNVAYSRFIATDGLESASASGTTNLNVTDSTIGQSLGYGVYARSSAAGGIAYAHVTRCTIEKATAGAYAQSDAGGTANIYIGSSTVTGGAIGFFATGTGAAITSMGNNDLYGNDSATNGAYSVGTAY